MSATKRAYLAGLRKGKKIGYYKRKKSYSKRKSYRRWR